MKQKTFTDTALGVAPIVLFFVWVATLVWMRDAEPWHRTAHFLLFVIAAYGISAVAQVRADRRLDEVELAAARFGARWGLTAGIFFVTVLTFLPPVHSLLADIAGAFSRAHSGYPTSVETRMFLLGIVTTFIAQETFRCIFAAAWKWSKR
jgi:hypothetical protein